MCGIAGFVDCRSQSSLELLKTFTDVLSHRGPDGSGYEFLEEEKFQVGLGHRRLSIIDLSDCASQPMWYKHWCIIFNGEIYNYKELKQDLLRYGHKFETESDTEVILHCFEQWGVHMIGNFIGMFAFAIYDAKNGRLTCFRDRAGIKPFYYYLDAGLMLFSSELKSFHKHPGFPKIIDPDAVYQFLQYGYIMTPTTIYKKTYKLSPGHYLEYDILTRRVEEVRYWDVYEHYNKPKLKISKSEAEEEMEKLLVSACNYRMIADVPIGVFLSGGYDSTAVTALIQASRTEKIKTYTIGFYEDDHNEAHHAKKVAEHLGTDHTEHYCTVKEAQEIIPSIPFFCDEPFGDSSIIPTILVSQLARKEVKVALSADAGDETFAGYGKYPLALDLNRKMNYVPEMLRTPAGYLLNKIPDEWLIKFSGSTAAPIKKQRFADALKRGKIVPLDVMDNFLSQIYSDKQMQNLFNEKVKKPDSHFDDRSLFKPGVSDLSKLLAVDYKTYMTDDILTKVDRAGMSVSLEGREPLLDYRLIELAAQLPDEYKMKGNEKKIILRDIVHKYVPKEMMDRPKMGFGVPVFDWLRNDLKFYASEYMSDAAFEKHGLFKKEAIQHIMQKFYAGDRNYNSLFWYLLMFQMWYKQWMD